MEMATMFIKCLQLPNTSLGRGPQRAKKVCGVQNAAFLAETSSIDATRMAIVSISYLRKHCRIDSNVCGKGQDGEDNLQGKFHQNSWISIKVRTCPLFRARFSQKNVTTQRLCFSALYTAGTTASSSPPEFCTTERQQTIRYSLTKINSCGVVSSRPNY